MVGVLQRVVLFGVFKRKARMPGGAWAVTPAKAGVQSHTPLPALSDLNFVWSLRTRAASRSEWLDVLNYFAIELFKLL